MKKYYAVKVGKKTGIYESWEKCKINVEGYPGAIYKSFSSYSDAENFLNDNKSKSTSDFSSDIVAYIDGSYDNKLKRYGYAAIIFYKEKKYAFSKSGNDPGLIEFRNVAGELKAAMKVMDYAIKQNVHSISIYYDYAGIEMWATSQWKAKNRLTQEYADYAKNVMKEISVKFCKVKSHTGDKFNEEVDKLAKESLMSFSDSEINAETDLKLEKIDNERVITENQDSQNSNKNNIDILISELKGCKTSLNLAILINNEMISTEKLMILFKKKWKSQKRTLKEIEQLKVYFDVNSCDFNFIVSTKEKDYHIIVGSGDFDGKK